MNVDLNQAREVFIEALGQIPAERWDAFLLARCGQQAELRRHVLHLLQAHQEAGSFLDLPAIEPTTSAASPVSEGPQATDTEVPSTVVGPYRLIEQIGEGGMGIVYLAQQTEPVQRLVALKLIKAGMDSRQVIARFE